MSLQNILNNLDKVKRIKHNEYKALCPVHEEKTPSLTISDLGNKIVCHCFGCGATGVDVVSALGMNIEELFNEKRTMNETYKSTQQDQEHALNANFLNEVSALTKKLTDDCPVVKYLHRRGIRIIPYNTIRFLPEYKQDGVYHPCLIARLDDKDGNRVSYKIIHLTHDGQKASVPVVKKTLPCEREMRGSAVKLFPHNGTLAVCEGIETALAHYQDTKIATWSLDNAGNLSQFDCPKDVKHLIIIPDMDSSFVGQAAAYALAKRAKSLVGKEGYKLESVTVNLLMRFQADIEVLSDNGVNKFDYLDYYIQDK
ncbi:TOPRIM domain containing protein [uncultured Caudovirales phage]|uniref:TOPRIM domain containing protein n=1 Tax=uncultured Caudovirales phage TaxID=2100421 RepID=A0A6J5LGG4_9CAUD|nr:TOPRIM domain containing protein [uncultured Caudovirales phage]